MLLVILSLICFLNFGITDPDESKTFPNLTMENFVISLSFY